MKRNRILQLNNIQLWILLATVVNASYTVESKQHNIIIGQKIFLIFFTTTTIASFSSILSPIHALQLLNTSTNNYIKYNSTYVFQFKHNLYNLTIPENSIGNTYALQPSNEDNLGVKIIPGLNLNVKFRIINGDRDKLFKIEERIVGDFAFLFIQTRTGNVILNREKTDEYRLNVKAITTILTQNETQIKECETLVIIKVLDQNDLSPLFYPIEYIKTVMEDMPLHKSILQVFAEDADYGINGEIYYSFFDDIDNFAIHPTTGIISLTKPLKYIEKSVHYFTVQATDRGVHHGLNQVSKAKVIINVEPVNLHAPEIFVHTLPQLIENRDGYIYGTAKVLDKDFGIHGQIKSLKIVGGDPDGHFRLIPTNKNGEYDIKVYFSVDREQSPPQGYNLTLHAIDNGIPPLSSYKIIPVQISDVNDNAPIFSKETYEVSVPEIAPPNTPVIRLKVTDRDQGKNAQVTLKIVGGNEGGEFYINPDTGMLYTQKPLDAETKTFYTLTVSAIDQGNTGTRKQSSAKVKINVEDSNDNDPIFEYINKTIWIDENEPSGAMVVKLQARDKDSGENAYISYSIANLNEVPFTIDPFTGIVRTTNLIDYESMRREYILAVRASDWGVPYRRQAEIELIIKIKDINDNRPQFERVDCTGTISRNLQIGAEILTLSAIDYDSNNYISYRIVSGNKDGCFNLDVTSGVLSIGCDLKEIEQQQHEIDVVATDGTHFSDTMTIQIQLKNIESHNFYNEIETKMNKNINDFGILMENRLKPSAIQSSSSSSSFECRDTGVARVQAEMLASAEKNNVSPSSGIRNQNDLITATPIRYGENIHAPELINFPLELKINETVKLGHTIAWIKAHDRDLGYNGKMVYSISSGDNDSVFRLDYNTGELQIIGYLDRERQDEYILNITVYDLGKPQKSISKMLPITVLDENDNPPKFNKSIATFHIPENAINKTIIFRVNATDADIGENAKISYSLITETNDFAIDQNTGEIYVNNSLDREKMELYELRVRATDMASVPNKIRKRYALHSDAFVRIIIDDINDNAPEFSLNEYIFRVEEDIPKRTVVAIVNAIDKDLGLNGEILYSLVEEHNNEDMMLFKVDKHTGVIRTAGSLDYEKQQIHKLTLKAIDRGTPALTAEVSVIIEIIDVNENRYAPHFKDFVLIGSVTENKSNDTFVMQVVATDEDPIGPDSRITYSIKGGDGLGLFNINNEGLIKTMAIFDIETKTHYWLTVCAQDQAIVPLESCIQVFIQILNENDNVPLTEKAVYFTSVPEASLSGVKILQLIAKDKDIDPYQRLTYRITSGNPEGFFTINSTTGEIMTTARKLDRENQSEHTLEITISDNGTPALSSTTRVIISVDDINDHGPEFDQRFYKVQIPSNAKFNQTLFQVLAVDNDIGENGRITYFIKSGKGKTKFRINPDTGIVYAAKQFDADVSFDLSIRAEDNGSPKKAQTARVNIIVIKILTESKHSPIIKSTDQVVEVTESDRPGFLITLIQAFDEDNDQLWYDIIDGDPENKFYIGRDNGNVLLAKALDWETCKNYNLTISVNDGIHSTTTQLYINVIDTNDHRPEFSEFIYKVNVSENIEEESIILKLHATDLDDDEKIFYTLYAAENPTSLSMFRIDSVTGDVYVTQQLDRELIAEHVLIAAARDKGTPAKRNYAGIIITVRDCNDHTPEFTSKIMQAKIYESAEIGTVVIQVSAIDRDIDENAKITYSIVGGNVGNVFSIDSENGKIYISKKLNIDSVPEYMLQIKANDNGQPSLSSQIPVHIIVSLADNDPPRFVKDNIAVEIFENLPKGTFVVQVEAISTSSVSYEIANGNVDDMFEINLSSGIITTKNILDYESKKYFNLTIVAFNMASISSKCTVVIHILDENDNAPYFLQNFYKGEISESEAIGSLVLLSENVTKTSFNKESSNSFFSNKLNTNSRSPLIIKALDLDSGLNAILHYDIVEGLARQYFHFDSTTGTIKTLMQLDYEETSQYIFTVKISDSGKPKLYGTTTATVQITVLNVNDCAPVFDQNEYNITLLLPTYENIVVTQIRATDPDSLDDEQITYDITKGNSDGIFTIDSKTGIITTKIIDNMKSFYKLHVRATDGKHSNFVPVNIEIETSENYGLAFQKSIYEGSVSENTTKISTITILNVIGAELNEHIEFRILNPTDMFRIGLTSGALQTTGKSFDREERSNYELIIEARSNLIQNENDKPRVAHAIVNVTVLDVNDNCPMFVNLPYYAVVSVDDLKGAIIAKVQAIDLDSFENGEVRYEMKRGYGELFKVDRKTGEITLKQTLANHNSDYELIIAAYDSGTTPCSTEVPVLVKVIDKSMPAFNKQFYSGTVKENIEVYSPTSITVRAKSPLDRKLIYTITKGNEMEEFSIDPNTGTIYVFGELDYERKQHYELVVRAVDSISGVFAEVAVSILIQDVNDNPPEFLQYMYNVSVSESTSFGTAILQVKADDNDSDINAEILYTIQQDEMKNNSEYFHMDPKEGILYLKMPLDYEITKVHHLTIIATDQGVPNLNSTAHVWINVIDANDNPPKFEQLSYSCNLSEYAERGQFVTMVTASDPDYIDHGNLIYEIVEGNAYQTYDIDPLTGVITLKNMQNFSDNRVTILKLSVTDGVYISFTTLKINILPENSHHPVFKHLIIDAKVNENQLAGLHVITVTATDKDFGKYGEITYDIFSDDMKEYFTIDRQNGIIETKMSFDREKREIYEIVIIATDYGGKSGFTTVKVEIIDENDNAPKFLFSYYKATINANHALYTTFLNVKAKDIDKNEYSAITYNILHATENNLVDDLFEINKNTGDISLKSSLEKLENQTIQFLVRATDGNVSHLYSDVPIHIIIISKDQMLPRIENNNSTYILSESSSPGTLITRIRLTDVSNVKYKIISENADNHLFAINEKGELYLRKTLDREEFDFHTIGVLCEINESLAIIAEFHVFVKDENDNEPIFENQIYNLEIAENIEKNSIIMKVTAHDADYGSNGDIHYRLQDNVVNIFGIDQHNGYLTNLVPLDREENNEYNFKVFASDNGQTKHIKQVDVMIKLKDYNDNSLVFNAPHYEASVSEDALPGTVLTQLSVNDKDIEIVAPIEFYIIAGDPGSQFQIKTTGELFVLKALDREMKSHYSLSLIATDGKFIAKTNVSVTVKDVNDNPPYCLKYRYQETINESIALDTYILQVSATDADEDTKLRFYLTGNGSDDFYLDNFGNLKTAKQLDRETKSRYFMTAHIQDHYHLSWQCSSKIEIIVTDVNDNAPEFTTILYEVTLPEDAEIGTLVTKVHAIDKDIGLNRKVQYSFMESDIFSTDQFEMSSSTGIITLAKPLDRESVETYELTVIATDQGIPKLSSTVKLIVNVQDINDNPPEFTSKQYFATVSEMSSIGTIVTTLTATSLDDGVNAEVYYSIIDGNEGNKFKIDRNTGVVTTNGELDYEKIKNYMLTVQVIDGGTPPLSNLAVLNVSITDTNDNIPQFLQNSYNARIREDAMIGDKILQVKAFDADSEENGRISYFIESGDRLQQFHIDEDTGYISVAANLDRETISNYVLEIRAQDNGIPNLFNYVHVSIEISDVNDNPPHFDKYNYSVVVQEDKQLGHVILKFDITDADANPNAAPYTFDFCSGNDGGAFRLEQDGTLRTATRFNHKVRNSYNLQICVFDNGTPPLYSDAWVNVKVIEESQYPPVITPLEILINSYQNEFAGGKIGTVYATDQDQYDTLTYDLESAVGYAQSKKFFNISKNDGTLIALSDLNAGDYKLNVTVSDGKFMSFAVVRIIVEVITPEMLLHAVVIRFENTTPEDFILSHRKGFIRSIRTAMRTRQKDIVIITVQKSLFNNETLNAHENLSNRRKRSTKMSTLPAFTSSTVMEKNKFEQKQTEVKNNLDVVFTVKKQQVNPLTEGYFSTKEIIVTVMDNLEEIEEMANLVIEEILQPKCDEQQCVYGFCKNKIMLDKNVVHTIATDVTSFVALKYRYIDECECKPGYGGVKCDTEISACARNPCPSYKKCILDDSAQGFNCICPDKFSEITCDASTRKCNNETCYQPINPVSFSGKSYIQYGIDKNIIKNILEDQLTFSLKIRTVQQTGNLICAFGEVDYNLLEIVNGIVQYRFDLGSGEGLISVTSIYVSDGIWHEIKLERERNSARLTVDGKHVAQGSAPGINEILNLQSNDFYLGAEVKSNPSGLGFEDIQRGFIGCMDDIRLSQEILPLQIIGNSTIAVLKRFANVEFHCNPATVLVPLGVCGMQPCLNGGTCKDTGYGNFECKCLPRFKGPNCKEDLDPCASSPCLYGGKCKIEGYGNYSCECLQGMTGKRCQFGRFCSPNPCQNGGVCEEGDTGPLCICRGYKGLNCETDIDECDNHPCGNGATCINEAGSFHCICPPDLTGASCGDPLYSNSVTTKSTFLSFEHMIGVVCGTVGIILIIFLVVCCILCNIRSRKDHKNRVSNKSITLNSASLRDDYKRASKISNLEIMQQQSPLNCAPSSSSNDHNTSYPRNNKIFVNNFDTLKSCGSTAADDFEIVPLEYQKLNCTINHQQIKINAINNPNDGEIINKQIQLKSFMDNNLYNDGKKPSEFSVHKSSGILHGRLLNVPVSNQVLSSETSSIGGDSSGTHGLYHWDCSDWARRSHNPLPNITEVPGSEVQDSSSSRSNESNESYSTIASKKSQDNQIDDMKIFNKDRNVESDSIENFCIGEYKTNNFNPLDIDRGDDNKGDMCFRRPKSYLSHYTPHSETDGETVPLADDNLKIINSLNIESEDDDISYGFPKSCNRRGMGNAAKEDKEDSESSSLLGKYVDFCVLNKSTVQFCEIEHLDFNEAISSNESLSTSQKHFRSNTPDNKKLNSKCINRTPNKNKNLLMKNVHQRDV